VSGLRNEIRADYDKTAARVEQAVTKMQDIHAAAMKEIGQLSGKLEAVNQQANATQQQVQRHIEAQNHARIP
jgi:prefoldin subunit 5